MVLAELSGGVSQRFERLGDRDIPLLQPDRRAGCAHLGQAGADRRLSGDERGTAGRATVLRVVVGEGHAFFADAVDVGRHVADDAMGVAADVGLPDVVAEDDENIGLFGLR